MTHPLARPVEADAVEMDTIRLATALPVSSSTIQPPPLTVKRPDATPAFRRAVINFLCRLDVCWTLFFFLFLVCVAAITTAITQTKISRALLENLHDIHSVRIATVEKGMDLLTERSFNMAAGFLSLYAQKGFAMQSEETLSRLCVILSAYDGSKDFKSLAVTSLARKEAISCMHGDANLGSKSQLYGWMTNQSIIPGVYLISNTTYTFLRPLQPVYGGWPTSVYNLSSTYDTLLSDNPAFTEAAAYFNGSIEYIDYRTLWRAFPTIPHIIYCNIPASFLFRGLNLPSNINVTDYVDVRVDGSTLLTTSNAASATRVTAAIFVNASLSDKDPLVMSDNWGQASVNDTEILTTYTPGQVTYLPVSNVSDPLMRAALKHVDFQALQQEGHSQNADFQFHGAPATVTATTYTTPKGLALPMVFVSSHADIAMPYRRIMNICNGVTAVVILLFTALFWYFIKSQLRDPLVDIATLLLQSVKRGTRALFRANRNHCVTLTEVQQLATAHNNAMRQLREIDTFIPEAVRQEIFHGNRMRLSQSITRSQTSLSLRSSLRAHAKLLLTHLTTVVYINIRPSRVAHQTITGAELRDGADQLPQRQRLAAVVANAARAREGTNTWPFSTSAVLGVFAEKLHELCVLHHGTVHRLCPDGGVLHFNKAVRAHLFVASSAASAKSASGSGGQPDGEAHPREAGLQRDERRCATQDAKDALDFAFGLQGWLGGFAASSVPDIRLLVDTSTFTCGHYRARGSDTTQSIALGRDVQREVGAVPAIIGVRIAMTEETASCLRAGATNDATGEIEPGVRQLPVEALRTGRVGLDADVVVLYEALPGPVLSDVAWQRYQLCCFDGFSFMVRGNYAAALQAYRRVMDIPNLEPGLMPTSLRREAAATNVTGGAVSVQVERLMRECVQHMLKRCTEGFHRRRQCPLGIDAVLKGAVRYSPTGGRSKRAACFPLKEDADFVAKRLGRYGVESHNATFTRTEGRNVGILPGTDIRTSYTGRPNSITDNWGTKWALSKSPASQRAQKTYDSLYSGLSETGNLCALTLRLYREVPAMVSRVLRDAPAGAMTDAMRSAVPVWQPTPPQRAAVCALLDARMRLRHPHILACLGYSLELEGGVMTALEYCKGGNLREVMARYDRVRVPTVCRTALSVLLGLRYLHAHGVVHGELRPECVLVCSDGVCRLKGFFADYALAHRVLCIPRTCYVSPEVAAGAAPTAASDIFGYGLVLLELLTQRLPWAWAAGDGTEPPRSAEDLAALAAAGGQAFSDAVVQGLVVPAVDALDDPEVVAVHPACGLTAVRACLPMNPRSRVSLEELISMSEGTAALIGLKATTNIDGGSSMDDDVLSSVFGAPNA